MAAAPVPPRRSARLIAVQLAGVAPTVVDGWFESVPAASAARTCRRPIPTGRVAPGEALTIGITLSLFSVLLLGLAVNWIAAALLAFANGFYVFVYTIWLKRRTPQNIVIGGAAGAVPPMIGWAAVTGAVGIESVALFLIIFMWTPPHFWALALYRVGDYAKAGVPMLPVVAGKAETRRQIFIYTVLLVPLSLAPTLLGIAGIAYGVVAATAGAYLLLLAIRVLRDRSEAAARRMFGYSIIYLFVLFAALIVERAFLTAVVQF